MSFKMGACFAKCAKKEEDGEETALKLDRSSELEGHPTMPGE